MSVYAKVWAYDQHPLQIDKNWKPKVGSRNPAAKAVLVALAEFPGVGQRECWPSQKTLSLMTDFDERTVRKHLFVLERQGFIKRTLRRKNGRRTTDMVTLLGPVDAFGPTEPAETPAERHAQPEPDAGSQPEPDAAWLPEPHSREPSLGTGSTESSGVVVVVENATELDRETQQSTLLPLLLPVYPKEKRDALGPVVQDCLTRYWLADAQEAVQDVVDDCVEEDKWATNKMIRGYFRAAHQQAEAKLKERGQTSLGGNPNEVRPGYEDREEGARRRREGYEDLFDAPVKNRGE